MDTYSSKVKEYCARLPVYDVQGDPTLSDKSNFDVTERKFGQISKVKVLSCSQMKNNLF